MHTALGQLEQIQRAASAARPAGMAYESGIKHAVRIMAMRNGAWDGVHRSEYSLQGSRNW